MTKEELKNIYSRSRIIFTKHALQRLKERGISKKEVLSVFRSYNKILRGYDNKKIIQKLIGKRKLEVVFTQEDNSIIIITAY